jgi:Rrf2 family cysteine metabolism transcriptional repressor
MLVTQKKQYALRAIFELGRRFEQGPVKALEIGEAQAIPLRFLEVILNQLRHGGLVRSKRGFMGGYILTRSPKQISVGQIFRLLDGKNMPSDCVACVSKSHCPFHGDCAFMPMWNKVQSAIDKIYDQTTIEDLLEQGLDGDDASK